MLRIRNNDLLVEKRWEIAWQSDSFSMEHHPLILTCFGAFPLASVLTGNTGRIALCGHRAGMPQKVEIASCH